MNLRIFYCTKDRNIYADTNPKSANTSLLLFAFISIMFYVMGRKIRLNVIQFSLTPVICVSILIGIVLGVVFSFYTDKKN